MRSEGEALEGAVRGRPGRRSAEDRRQAVLGLPSGQATVDQLARQFGVHAATGESGREQAMESIREALRGGTGKAARELEL